MAVAKRKRIAFLVITAVVLVIAALVICGVNHFYTYIYDRYTDDYFYGQTAGGVCTHDESYVEPIIPNGRYYPGGDMSADFYLEITENKYYQYKAADENEETLLKMAEEYNSYEQEQREVLGLPAKDGIDLETFADKKEFKVITYHRTDDSFFWTEWEEYRRVFKDEYRGEKYQGIGNNASLSFSDDGTVSLPAIAANPFRQYESSYGNSDKQDMIYCGNKF